jgi:ASC-1-like (ASCH) protein
MDHLAIMKKSWRLLPKILSGEKTIESRWYKNRVSPWGKIKKGEIIYFKDSGNPVTLRAEVSEVLQFSELTPTTVEKILFKYAARAGISKKDINKYYKLFKDKNYCLLVFLKNQKTVDPFEIDKSGFGLMSAWITVKDINLIKK